MKHILIQGLGVLLGLLVLSCTDEYEGVVKPPVNHAPEILSIEAERAALRPGEQTVVRVTAEDADGDSLRYAWTATTGAFVVPLDRDSVVWIAPDTIGSAAIRVEVSDGTQSSTVVKYVAVTNPAVPEIEWSWGGYYFGYDGNETCEDGISTSDGGMLITGTFLGPGEGMYDSYVVKLDETGYDEWERSYDFGGDEEVKDIVQTADGGWVIAGAYNSLYGFLLRANSTGEELWHTVLDTPRTRFSGVAELVDGDFALVGKVLGSDYYYDLAVIRVDAYGDRVWEARIDGGQNDEAKDVVALPDGGYMLVGHVGDFHDQQRAAAVRFEAESGQYDSYYFADVPSSLVNIVRLEDGMLAAAGTIRRPGRDDDDIYLVKFTEIGDVIWERTFGTPAIEHSRAISVLADGGFVIAGESNGYGTSDLQGFMLRTDEEGYRLWDTGFTSVQFVNSCRNMNAIGQTSNGGLWMGGQIYDPFDAWDVAVFKLYPEGE